MLQRDGSAVLAVSSFLLLWSTWTLLDLIVYSLPSFISLTVCAVISVLSGKVAIIRVLAEPVDTPVPVAEGA